MSTLALVIASGLAMSAPALVGSVTIGLPEATLARVTPALVGLAAGSLLGASSSTCCQRAVATFGNSLNTYFWVTGGFISFSCCSSSSTGTIATGRSRATSQWAT